MSGFARFLVRRIALGVVVMWIVSTVVFVAYFVAPNDAARLIAGRQADPATIAAVSRKLGLNRSVPAQYWSFMGRLLHGNLGYSYTNSEPVRTLISAALPVTLSVAIGGAVLWLLIGVGSGVLAALNARSLLDRAATVLALLFYSMPTFLLGELLLVGLFYQLHLWGFGLFPGGGFVPLTADPLSWAQHLLLPWLTIAAPA